MLEAACDPHVVELVLDVETISQKRGIPIAASA